MSVLKLLQQYAGNRKWFFPLSMGLSALSTIAGLVPYFLVWLIVKSLLDTAADSHTPDNVISYALWATVAAVLSMVIYFAALTASHLAAFNVESNLRRTAMKKIVDMPMGFFNNHTSGRIRKIIDDNASITHSFLAHQLPDLAATVLIPPAAIALLFAVDRRLSVACIVPIVVSSLWLP
jgi:ATP-binding cassette subfamily B protein